MQRPIKFRAWHRFTKIMFKHVCKLEFSNWNGEEHHLVSVFARNHDDQARLDEAKNWELLQFTGLKDKNGKEIYEGDIVRSIYGIGFIEFRDGVFIMHVPKDHSRVNDWFACDWNQRSIEVIGNIYENPELVKK